MRIASALTVAALLLAVCRASHADDLASLVAGRTAYEVIGDERLAGALREVMGDEAFADARQLAEGGTSAPAEETDGIVSAFACQPGGCGWHELRFAVDREGGAWASLTVDGRTSFYGDPPKAVRTLLTPMGLR